MNSAHRLSDLVQAANKAPDNTKTLEVWASVFDVDATDNHEKTSIVSSLLAVLHAELNVVRKRMAETHYSDSLYVPYLQRIENAISGQSLTTTWNNFKQYLTPDAVLALRFCSEILPKEEEPIDQEALEEILDTISQLEGLLTNTSLSSGVVDLINNQMGLIRRALGEYPIIGIKSVKRAVHTATGELVEHQEEVRQNASSEEMSLLRKILEKTSKTADGVIKTDKAISAGEKILSLIHNTFEKLS
jgi:hypothetical protein